MAAALAIFVVPFYGVALLAQFLVAGENRQYLVYLDYALALCASIGAVVVTRTFNAWVFLVAGLVQWPAVVLFHAAVRSAIGSADLRWDFIVPDIISPYGVPLHLGFLAVAGGVATCRALRLSVKQAFDVPPWREALEAAEQYLTVAKRILDAWKTISAVATVVVTVAAGLAIFRGCR